jgi:hypothetical protein
MPLAKKIVDKLSTTFSEHIHSLTALSFDAIEKHSVITSDTKGVNFDKVYERDRGDSATKSVDFVHHIDESIYLIEFKNVKKIRNYREDFKVKLFDSISSLWKFSSESSICWNRDDFLKIPIYYACICTPEKSASKFTTATNLLDSLRAREKLEKSLRHYEGIFIKKAYVPKNNKEIQDFFIDELKISGVICN